MPLETLSPSRASDYKQCPQLFKFRAIERLDEPVSAAQARGTTAHMALERLYDLPAAERTPERLYDLFRQAWTELRRTTEYSTLFDDAAEERAWGVAGMGLLANYFAIEDPAEVDPLDRELDMLEELGEMNIRGILDRIDRSSDGRLVITDYKSGSAPSERYARPAFFALKIYGVLVRSRTGETPAEVRLLYLNGPTLYRMAIDDRMLDGVERQLQALWTAIDQALDTDHFPPRPGWRCNWCAFRSRCSAFSDSDIQPTLLEVS